MKKILAIVLAAVLCMSLTTAAFAAEADPAADLADTRWYFGYAVEGLGDMVQFYHFYPDDLGIGAVFYAGYAWNQITFSGTWTVAEEPCDYEALPERGDEVAPVTGTAPYTITLTGWDGQELDKLAYDGEHVYNIAVNTNCSPMTGGGTYVLNKADDAALETYADTFEGELGIAYMNFVAPEDESCTLQLNTNGTYEDLMVMFVEGTWAKDESGAIVLTPASELDDGATVTEQEDGTWKYVSTSGDELVVNQVKEAAVAYTFKGTFPFNGVDADLVIAALDDGTCTATVAAFGMELAIDAGTYTFAEPAIFTFSFAGAGEIVSEFGGETGVQVTYTNPAVEAIGGAELTVTCGVVIG